MEKIYREIIHLLHQAGELVKEELAQQDVVVSTKSSRSDLVTNIDKLVQNYLMSSLNVLIPNLKFLAEENGLTELADFSGKVAVIDPIDGTNNMVLQQKDFCILLGLYEEKMGRCGFIYEVMGNHLLWGGPEIGVFYDDQPWQMQKDLSLEDGLISFNSKIFRENILKSHELSQRALGIRMTGCAGLEMMDIALGNRVAYISNLQPWDYAAGQIILEALGMKVRTISGKSLSLNGRELMIAATPKAYQEILESIGHA